MLKKCLWVLCVLLMSEFHCTYAEEIDPNLFIKKSFVILFASKDYQYALQIAKQVAEETKIPLNLRGLSKHTSNKLTFSKQACRDAGFEHPCYLTRAYDEDGEYVTIDWSNGFEDFQPGYFIVTAAGGKPGDAQLAKTLRRVKSVFPDAYVKTTRVYIGCMH